MRISLMSFLINLFVWGLLLYVFFFTEEVETYIFPKVILVILAVAGSGILLKEWLSSKKLPLKKPLSKDLEEKNANSSGKKPFLEAREIVLIVIICFYLFALETLGALFSSFLVFFAIAIYFHKFKIKDFTLRSWVNVVTVSIVFIGVLYWIFSGLLEVQLPGGVFDSLEE